MNNHYTAFEYKTVKVRSDQEPLWVDSMQNYGWKLEKSTAAIVKRAFGPLWLMIAPLALLPGTPFAKMLKDHPSDTELELTFKRDKNITGKVELDRLQKQFENCAQSIVRLEASPKITASAIAYIIGLAGAVFMGMAVFAYLASMLPLCIILAVPGFLCWALSYVAYRSIKSSKTQKVAPAIEEQHETIYSLCKSANDLRNMPASA